MKYDIGTYRDRADILEISLDGDGNYVWQPIGKAWCRLERTGVYKIFSKVGLSAEGWTISMRERPISLIHALSINGRHYFICELERPERGFLEVTAVNVTMVTAIANANRPPEERFTFPACMTELYVKHEQREPMSVNIIDYVIVTPKVIELKAGSLVAIDGVRYELLAAHTLDEAKNEYELRKVVDL